MILSGKTEVASPERLSGHNQSRFRTLEYDRVSAPDSIFYSELHRYVVKAELPPKTREKTNFGLAQFVIFKNNCLLAYTPRDHPDTRRTSTIVDYSKRNTHTSYRIAAAVIQKYTAVKPLYRQLRNDTRKSFSWPGLSTS